MSGVDWSKVPEVLTPEELASGVLKKPQQQQEGRGTESLPERKIRHGHCTKCGFPKCICNQQEGQERYKIEPWREGGNVVRDYEDSKCVIGGFGIPHHQAELICNALNQSPKPDSVVISRDDAKIAADWLLNADEGCSNTETLEAVGERIGAALKSAIEESES